MDVKVRAQNGRLFNVEMQMLPYPFFSKRILYYWSKMYAPQLQEGEHYEQLRPTVSICFLNNLLFPEVPDYHLRFQLRNADHQVVFTDDIEVHTIELPKFARAAEEVADPLEVWAYFLRHAERLDTEALPAALNVPPIHRALEELLMLTQNDLERERYEARMKLHRDEISWRKAARDEGRQEGIKEGIIGQIHLCQRLLKRDVTPSAELEALPLEELHRRVEQMEKELLA